MMLLLRSRYGIAPDRRYKLQKNEKTFDLGWEVKAPTVSLPAPLGGDTVGPENVLLPSAQILLLPEALRVTPPK